MSEKKIAAVPHSSIRDYDRGVNIRDGMETPLHVFTPEHMVNSADRMEAQARDISDSNFEAQALVFASLRAAEVLRSAATQLKAIGAARVEDAPLGGPRTVHYRGSLVDAALMGLDASGATDE